MAQKKKLLFFYCWKVSSFLLLMLLFSCLFFFFYYKNYERLTPCGERKARAGELASEIMALWRICKIYPVCIQQKKEETLKRKKKTTHFLLLLVLIWRSFILFHYLQMRKKRRKTKKNKKKKETMYSIQNTSNNRCSFQALFMVYVPHCFLQKETYKLRGDKKRLEKRVPLWWYLAVWQSLCIFLCSIFVLCFRLKMTMWKKGRE